MLHFYVTLNTLLADRIKRNDRGATAVEYGLMVSLIALAIILTVTAVGGQLDALFEQVRQGLGGAPAAG